MRRGNLILILLIALAVLPLVSAAFTFEKTAKADVIIAEMDNPAVYEYNFTNFGSMENIEIYSLVGVSFVPRGLFELAPGKTVLEVKAYPSDELRKKSGLFAYAYEIRGESSGIQKDKMLIKIVSLKEAISISAENLAYDDEEAIVIVKNNENTYLNNMAVKFSSEFFDEGKTVSLKPFEEKKIALEVKGDNVLNLKAGSYVINADVQMKNASARIGGVINYIEKQNVSEIRKIEGWLARKLSIARTNEGNTVLTDRIEVTKNVLTRLFTTNSIEPLKAERKGLSIKYVWSKEIKPGESWSVITTTNYTLPFMLVALIVLIAAAYYIYTKTNVVVRKRVSYVRTKGGQFALKVTLNVRARKGVENVHIVDRIPMAMKLYEGYAKPHQIDTSTRRLMWNIDKLNAGEERIFSYIIYSSVGVVGRFEAPVASATFTHGGKHEIVHSNRAYFISGTH